MRNDADIIEAKDNSTEEQRYLCSIPGMMEKKFFKEWQNHFLKLYQKVRLSGKSLIKIKAQSEF